MKEIKRQEIVDKYAEKRAELKERARKGDRQAYLELQKLPRNASPTRLRNRCLVNGRPRDIWENLVFQELCLENLPEGAIPGVKKSSW